MDLVCKNISKKFGFIKALEKADISLNKGEIRALLGGNGSGKSTFARILAGNVKKDSGEIYFCGNEYKINSPKDAQRQKVYMTCQELSLFTNLTVAENLNISDIPLRNKIFADQRKMYEKAQKILNDFGILHALDKTVNELPPNQQYLLEFAKAILQNPRLLIVDEITSALYKEDVELVKKYLFKLKQQGCIVIFITHRMPEIYQICDTVTVLRNGRTVGDFSTKEVDEITLLSKMTNIDFKKDKNQKINIEKKGQELATRKVVMSVKDMKLGKFGSKVSLEVKQGDIIGVAGLEGHGQSDLIRKLFGLQGDVDMVLDGNNVNIKSPRDAVKKGIAFISGDRESEGTFGVRSISDNLRVVKDLVLKQKCIPDPVALKNYGVVYGTPRQVITSLSGGNQQKVVIGRWMETVPKLLLADDPTKGIDVQARSDVHSLLVNLANKGSAVIIVSSDEEELIFLSKKLLYSKVIVMYEGQIQKILEGNEINEKNIAVNSMNVER